MNYDCSIANIDGTFTYHASFMIDCLNYVQPLQHKYKSVLNWY